MKLCSLSSGSKGNAILVYTQQTKVLVDCGISGKALEACLKKIGLSPAELNAIVVTHEHSDHTKGVGVAMRRFDLPVYANSGTWAAMVDDLGKLNEENIKIFKGTEGFEIGDIGIQPFEIPHDAAQPVGYRFESGGGSAAVATDIGALNEGLFRAIRGCRTVLLEANHDVNLLEIGSYPFPLKRRIRGALGHLSNDEAGLAAVWLTKLGTEQILLGHLSEENNYPGLALQTVQNALAEQDIRIGRDVLLDVATRAEVSRVFA